MSRSACFRLLALGVFAASVLLPTQARAYIVKSVELHLDDTDVMPCQNVTAKVSFCIMVQREDISGDPPVGLAKVPIRLVYDEWGEDSDYEGEEGDVGRVCERTFDVPFNPEDIGKDICQKMRFLCQFHASTYDYGWTTDPDFYACAKSGLSGAKNKYSGEIEVEVNSAVGLQGQTASLLPAYTGAPVAVAVTPYADLPLGSSGSFVVSVDPRTATLLDASPMPDPYELEPGVWLFDIPASAGPFVANQPLVTLTASVIDDLLYGRQRIRNGVGVYLSDVQFSDSDGYPIDTTGLLAFGYDQDADGLPVPLEDEIDGDGVHDDDDAFPLNASETADTDEDGLGDNFEMGFFMGLQAGPDEDPDSDGSTNLEEFRAGTDPTNADSDTDTVPDGTDAFPLDNGFSVDIDGDLVPDPLDAFPTMTRAAFDSDSDGLGDNWEMFWFGSLAVVDAAGDFDYDTVSNLEEFLADSNPVTLPIAPIFTGGGIKDIGGAGVDALLYPTKVNEVGGLVSATINIDPGQPTISVEFGFSETADLNTLTALWNGENLFGPDGRRQTGDEPFETLVFDIAYGGSEIRISGLPVAGKEQNQLELSISSVLNAAEVDTDTLDVVRPAPTCVFGEEDFIGGLQGFCESSGGVYDLLFEDSDSNHVLSLQWPGSLVSPPATDCAELCQAGALQVAYETDRMNLRRDSQCPVLPRRKQCSLAPNGSDQPYDLCAGGGKFECFLACGKACVGCEVKEGADCGGPSDSCKTHEFECYKRNCCVVHDTCLANATNDAAKTVCHVEALRNGCDMADARGQTHTYTDASCFDPADQCIGVTAKPTTQACCIDGDTGQFCQDLTIVECLAAGGTAQGAGTQCSGPDGQYGTGDEPCHQSTTKYEAVCINSLNKAARKVSRTAAKDIQACYKNFAKGRGGAEACAGTAEAPGDPKNKLERAEAKTSSTFSKQCETKAGGPPPFGPQNAAQVNDASVETTYSMYEQLLGADLDLLPTTTAEARCIVATMKAAAKCQDAKAKEFLYCAAAGTRSGAITHGDVMQCQCLDPSIPDPRGRVAKDCGQGLTRATDKCVGPSIDANSALGAGSCAGELGDANQAATCIGELIDCEVCFWVSAVNGLNGYCDSSCSGN
jgi:hypothetical protein